MRIRLGGALVGFAVAGGGSGLGAARGMPLRPGHHDASGALAALPLSGPPPAARAPGNMDPEKGAVWRRGRLVAAGAGPGANAPCCNDRRRPGRASESGS